MPRPVLVGDSVAVHLQTPLAVEAPLLVRLPVELATWAESTLADSLGEGRILTLPLRQRLAHHLLLDLLAPSLTPHPGGVLSGEGLRGVPVATREWVALLLPRAEVVWNQSDVVDGGGLRLELRVALHQPPKHVGAVSPPLVGLLACHTPADVNLEARLVSVVTAPHQSIRL